MNPFMFYQPTRIIFGRGKRRELGSLIDESCRRCLLITTEDEPPLGKVYEEAKDLLSDAGIQTFHFSKVSSNPTTRVVEEAVEMAKSVKADCVLAVGGGSSIDTAKIVASFSQYSEIEWERIFTEFSYENVHGSTVPPEDGILPLIAVPTTSGTGSHVTQAAVITDSSLHQKRGVFHPCNYPGISVIDPELMLTLPPRLTAATAFDAFSHAFESYMQVGVSPMVELLALEAIRLVCENLTGVLQDGFDIEKREKLALADTLAGIALSNAGGGLPHPLGELVGGVCPRIMHGETLAIVYPEYIRILLEERPERVLPIIELLPVKEEGASAETVFEAFMKEIRLDVGLSDFHVTQSELSEILSAPVLSHLGYPRNYLQQIFLDRV